MQGILIIAVLFGVLWFAMIRPQRAKVQAQQRLLNTVEVGDEILTVGGIYGIVQEVEPDEEAATWSSRSPKAFMCASPARHSRP